MRQRTRKICAINTLVTDHCHSRCGIMQNAAAAVPTSLSRTLHKAPC